ncbi:MAG: tetratricopeptide repeat protein [bacterium]
MNIQKSLLLALCVVASGCMTSRDYGDRAFEAGRYNEALDNYEKAVEEGVRDHEMFRRAAQASLNTGDFSGAERYYSQALRNGAGLDVARELAQFYVKTNNFVSAVRVYEYLLNTDPNVQAVYNNLGTALLYANKPFDAETYLMIAQQMEPDDPYPYLNLGILYDQHLRQPREAVGFYRCYQQFAPKQDSTYQLTGQRIAEIEERWGEDPPIVTCGKPFEPQKAKAVVDLRKELEVEGELDLGMEGPTEGPIEVQLLVTEPVVTMVPAETNQAKKGDEAWTARNWAKSSRLTAG